MNGFRYDSIYLQTDQMACAEKKMAALANCESIGISTSISCILIRDMNTHLVSEIIDFAHGLKKPARINFRNIGSVGRNLSQERAPLSLDEMAVLLAQKIGRSTEDVLSHKAADNQIRIPILDGARRSQQIILKITDWSIFAADKVFDPKSGIRGRITQDFKVAPAFEHIKENEFGY
jgi:molybdenum cofactor biosynthesis enzyme MoaA